MSKNVGKYWFIVDSKMKNARRCRLDANSNIGKEVKEDHELAEDERECQLEPWKIVAELGKVPNHELAPYHTQSQCPNREPAFRGRDQHPGRTL